MKTLEFSPAEIETLRDVVHRKISDMEVEILHTDSRDFKAMLKHRKEALQTVLAKLGVEPVVL